MSNDPDQYYTPYERGYMAGLGMAQSDPATWQELEAMISNPNIDKDFHRGLVTGRQEAMHQLSARDNDEAREKAFERTWKQEIDSRDDFDLDYE